MTARKLASRVDRLQPCRHSGYVLLLGSQSGVRPCLLRLGAGLMQLLLLLIDLGCYASSPAPPDRSGAVALQAAV